MATASKPTKPPHAAFGPSGLRITRRAHCPAHADVPFRMSLDPNDRDQIVRLSSDFTIPGYKPPAIGADKLYLSTFGAWMDVLGDFDPLSIHGHPFNLLQWRHIAGMARDSYVRVVTAGYLCHPGNRAVLIKTTERKFQLNPSGTTTAYLRQRLQLLVKEPEKDYSFLDTARAARPPLQEAAHHHAAHSQPRSHQGQVRASIPFSRELAAISSISTWWEQTPKARLPSSPRRCTSSH